MRRRSEVMKVISEKLGPPIEENLIDEAPVVTGDPPKVKEKTTIKFESANRPGGVKGLTGGFEKIIEKIIVVDIEATYDRLEEALRVGEKRNDRQTLMKALDNAESNARKAHDLLATAKIETERWEADNLPIIGAMREKATEMLSAERTVIKEEKGRAKMITDADVDGMAATMFPEEWKAQKVARERTKMIERSIENLLTLWTSRCRTLQAMGTMLR